MTTNLRPTTQYLLSTPDGFIHNVGEDGCFRHLHVCEDLAYLQPTHPCPHGFTILLNTRGPWMATYTGRRYYFLNPLLKEIVIEDIAHHLSMQSRYNGACKSFYSVAEHSVRVATAVFHHHYREHFSGRDGTVPAPPMNLEVAHQDALATLLHDAHEAYLGDVVNPLKYVIAPGKVHNPHGIPYDGRVDYRDLETIADSVIYPKFTGTMPTKEVKEIIRHYDLALLKHEARALLRDPESQWEEWSDLPDEEGLSPIEQPWSPSEARDRFLHAFAQYGGQS